jgi:uncharacterized phage protein (TIGR01671 family)
MRNLKFRVRDTIDNEWESANCLVCHNFALDSYHIGELKYIADYPDQPERYIIQQESGLVDVNNNPIFEGDIVIILDDYNFYENYPDVWTMTKVKEREGVSFKLTRNDGKQHNEGCFTKLEIIGNIFEPPMLNVYSGTVEEIEKAIIENLSLKFGNYREPGNYALSSIKTDMMSDFSGFTAVPTLREQIIEAKKTGRLTYLVRDWKTNSDGTNIETTEMKELYIERE